MASGVQEWTEARNMGLPSRKMIVEWVLTAWSWLSTDVIAKSFKSGSLNLAVDGFDNSEIHCLKKGQACEVGAEQLEAQLSILDEPNFPNPFEEVNNENKITLDEDTDIDVES